MKRAYRLLRVLKLAARLVDWAGMGASFLVGVAITAGAFALVGAVVFVCLFFGVD